jgi:mono/diheme cytochrome c family protein
VRLRTTLCLLVTLASWSGCGNEREAREWRPEDHQPPSGPADPTQAEPVDPGAGEDVTRMAAALWRVQCASCHGVEGRGDGPARPPGVVVPDLTTAELQANRSDEDLAEVIRNGRGTMPGFGSAINERGIEVLVAYVRSLRAE